MCVQREGSDFSLCTSPARGPLLPPDVLLRAQSPPAGFLNCTSAGSPPRRLSLLPSAAPVGSRHLTPRPQVRTDHENPMVLRRSLGVFNLLLETDVA